MNKILLRGKACIGSLKTIAVLLLVFAAIGLCFAVGSFINRNEKTEDGKVVAAYYFHGSEVMDKCSASAGVLWARKRS